MDGFQTPGYIAELMVSRLSCMVDVVLEPTPGNGNIVKELQRQRYTPVIPKKDFWDMDFTNFTKRIDAIVMNPPFSPMKLGYKFLYKCMELSDIIVALMPWLTLINSKRRFKDIINFGLVSVIHLDRSVFKGSRVQTCILHMKKHFKGTTKFLWDIRNRKEMEEKQNEYT
jgi:hypothetical protein